MPGLLDALSQRFRRGLLVALKHHSLVARFVEVIPKNLLRPWVPHSFRWDQMRPCGLATPILYHEN
eukprot:9128887-Prorocentrum_lima.AAC.1